MFQIWAFACFTTKSKENADEEGGVRKDNFPAKVTLMSERIYQPSCLKSTQLGSEAEAFILERPCRPPIGFRILDLLM